MVKKSSLLFIVFLVTLKVIGQHNTFNVLSVERLNDSINSDAEEILPLLTTDGQGLYFARILHPENVGGKYSGSDIWYSDRVGDSWGPASNKQLKWNDPNNNFIIGIHQSEEIIYLNDPKSPDKGIQYSKHIGPIWTKPERIKLKGLPAQGYQGAYVSNDFSIIIISAVLPDSYGKEDLYLIKKDSSGRWGKPENLGSTINSEGSEISPFLSDDKQTLYFSSDGHGGFGNHDIVSSTRQYESWTIWDKVRNLGEDVNSASFDAYYVQYGDSIGYFSSNRDGKLADIFKVNYMQNPEDKFATDLIPLFSSVTQKSARRYLRSNDFNAYFGIDKLPSLSIQTPENLEDDKYLSELIWFLHNKLKANEGINLVMSIEGSKFYSTDKLYLQAIEVANYVSRGLMDLGISQDRLYFDGLKKSDEEGLLINFNAFMVN